jgi:hypothetical protein
MNTHYLRPLFVPLILLILKTQQILLSELNAIGAKHSVFNRTTISQAAEAANNRRFEFQTRFTF